MQTKKSASDLHGGAVEKPASADNEQFRNGTPIVPGVSYGRCMILAGDSALKNINLTRTNDVVGQKRLLREAIENVRETLKTSARQIHETLTEADEGIFQISESLLDDPTLRERIEKYLDEKVTLPSALALTAQSFQEEFQQIQDNYLRERLLDVQDVLLRLLDALQNTNTVGNNAESQAQDTTTPIVLVARELFPSQFLAAPLKRVCGIVCETGGPTSHVAILARALRIPMMVDVPKIHETLSVKDKVLVDCRTGLCFPNPNAKLLKQYQLVLNISRRNRQTPSGLQVPPVDDTPQTIDGTPVKLAGNITLFSEVPVLHSVGIREIGLYRTEFMFLIRNNMPDEETQYRILSRLIAAADGADVVIRALDIGGDKPLPYIQWGNELNPSLGWRGLRFLLTSPELARVHLRAILRACVAKNARLLFPMVSDVNDILRAKALVRSVQEELAADGLKYGVPAIGMMLEMPSAVLALERLLPEVDFVSIGTNDLVQYLFAVDRGNSRVKQWYQQCHPIVIQLLGKICQTVAKYPGKELELCGEMGANISAFPALLGAGLRKFSMNPSAIANIRNLIRKVRMNDCQDLYQRICELDTAEQVQRLLDDFMISFSEG